MFITTLLRDIVAARLKANNFIRGTGAEIVTRERGQLPSQLAEIIASLKLAIVVFPAVVEECNPNTKPLLYERVSLTIRVTETILNDTNLEAEELAEMLHTYLHSWHLPDPMPGRPLLFSDPVPMVPGQDPVTGSYYIDCNFFTQGIAAPER